MTGHDTSASFREILHSAISAGLCEGIDETQIANAITTHQGWMHINGMPFSSGAPWSVG